MSASWGGRLQPLNIKNFKKEKEANFHIGNSLLSPFLSLLFKQNFSALPFISGKLLYSPR